MVRRGQLPQVVKNAVEPRIRPASKGEALLALAPTSLLQIPSPSRGVKGFNNLAQLAEQVPSYHLELGSDVRSIPRLVGEIVADEVSVGNP